MRMSADEMRGRIHFSAVIALLACSCTASPSPTQPATKKAVLATPSTITACANAPTAQAMEACADRLPRDAQGYPTSE
jgi:hypothetical protein